ncbi:MAG: hypothetical protein U5K79_16135 [Cyclobacteriaceae bacterium]|nr:hypothetical protein [Cyclobacteriaceae bacterium]
MRDSSAVSFLPLSLIYNLADKTPVAGITVLPVDLNGNGRVGDDEKFYGSLENVIKRLEETASKDINNLPIEYLNLSVDKNSPNPLAVEFLTWVLQNEESSLHKFGYLSPAIDKSRNESFLTFASKFKK